MAVAAVVPLLSTIGGGSALAGGIILGTTVASGVGSAIAAKRAGKIADAQSVIDANAEGDAARGREIERKKALARSTSSRLAAAGASGVSFSEGSADRITQLDINEARRDQLTDTANSRQKQRGIRAQGRAARFQGNMKFATSLLDTAKSTAGLF